MPRFMILLFFVLAVLFTAHGSVAQQPDTRPNIVWIFVEDMNGWLGCYGDDTVPTPHLDAIAEQGMRFDRAYMTAGVCSSCRSAIALGAMQTTLGVHNHRSSRNSVPGDVIQLPDGVRTVYELMQEAGYYVSSNAGKNDFNFTFSNSDLYDRVVPGMNIRGNQHWADCPEGTPFFAQIQLLGGKNSGDAFPLSDPADVQVPPYYPDHPVIRESIAHHYDCIRQTDDEVGQIIAALEADDLLDNTIVIFWTDHGMELYRHKQWLYEGGIRVPLIMMGPAIEPGSVRNDLISGIDISATTLAIAGVDYESLGWIEGRDFLAGDHIQRDYIIAARDRCGNAIDRVRCVTTEQFAYIRNYIDRPFMQPHYRDGRDYIEVPRQMFLDGELNDIQAFWWLEERVPEELYDLINDPHQTINLANDPAYAEVLEQHRAILEQWIQETDDQGQYPEPDGTLMGALERCGDRCINPEYDRVRGQGNTDQ